MLYAAGACLHALPWSELPNSDTVFTGFLVSAYGTAAFGAGWCFGPALRRNFQPQGIHSSPNVALWYVSCGMISFFVLQPLLKGVPSINSVAIAAGQLMLAGLCLGAFLAYKRNGWRSICRWLAPALVLPLVTVLKQGFLGYGVIALSAVTLFCATFVRPRWIVVAALLIGGYCGLSVFVAYMQTRNEIRAAVWTGADLRTRLSGVSLALSRVKPFDFFDQNDLLIFDGRMDQSYLAGLAVDRLSSTGEYVHGETLTVAAVALIPRIFWPGKPFTGGSGNLVSRFTGLTFSSGTSVGIGPVMELYANYGIVCVLTGFFVLGLLLSYIDHHAAVCLQGGDSHRFVLWFLVGISFLQASGSFVEVISTGGASIVAAQLVNALLSARTRIGVVKTQPDAQRVQIA